jgi:lipopolysaccharide biosynthesis glycosyltransferase
MSGSGADPAIVHFVTADKPWYWSSERPFKSEYHKYRRMTPWRRYQLEDQPRLLFLRNFYRAMLPARLRKWLRLRIMSYQV